MGTSAALLFFGTLTVAAIFSASKIQRAELIEARARKQAAIEAEQKRQARLAEYSARCFRPDGD